MAEKCHVAIAQVSEMTRQISGARLAIAALAEGERMDTMSDEKTARESKRWVCCGVDWDNIAASWDMMKPFTVCAVCGKPRPAPEPETSERLAWELDNAHWHIVRAPGASKDLKPFNVWSSDCKSSALAFLARARELLVPEYERQRDANSLIRADNERLVAAVAQHRKDQISLSTQVVKQKDEIDKLLCHFKPSDVPATLVGKMPNLELRIRGNCGGSAIMIAAWKDVSDAEARGRRAAFEEIAVLLQPMIAGYRSVGWTDAMTVAWNLACQKRDDCGPVAKAEAKPSEQPGSALDVEPLSEAVLGQIIDSLGHDKVFRDADLVMARAVAAAQRAKVRPAKLPTVDDVKQAEARRPPQSESCLECHGRGGRWDDEAQDQWYDCEKCSGTGRTLAEAPMPAPAVDPSTQPAPGLAPMPRLQAELDRLYRDCIERYRVRGWVGTDVFVRAARADMAEARKADAARIAELENELESAKRHHGDEYKNRIALADKLTAALLERDGMPVVMNSDTARSYDQAARELAELRSLAPRCLRPSRELADGSTFTELYGGSPYDHARIQEILHLDQPAGSPCDRCVSERNGGSCACQDVPGTNPGDDGRVAIGEAVEVEPADDSPWIAATVEAFNTVGSHRFFFVQAGGGWNRLGPYFCDNVNRNWRRGRRADHHAGHEFDERGNCYTCLDAKNAGKPGEKGGE